MMKLHYAAIISCLILSSCQATLKHKLFLEEGSVGVQFSKPQKLTLGFIEKFDETWEIIAGFECYEDYVAERVVFTPDGIGCYYFPEEGIMLDDGTYSVAIEGAKGSAGTLFLIDKQGLLVQEK